MTLAIALASALSLACAWAAFAAERRAGRRAREEGDLKTSELDAASLELEQRLAAKEVALARQVARRVGMVLSRVCLAAGTAFGVFILASERSLPHALLAFGAGLAGWAACQHSARKVTGLMAGAARSKPSSARAAVRSGPAS